MEADILAKLEWLMAQQELHDLNMRYCRATDRCDVALWRTTFHPDGTGDYGFFKGNGWEFGAKTLPTLRERFAATHHCIGNERFVIDGDRAEGEVSVFAVKSSKSDPREAEFTMGRYLDRYERRNGSWGLVHRRYILDRWDAQRFGEVLPNSWGEDVFAFGANDRSDPSYQYALISRSRA